MKVIKFRPGIPELVFNSIQSGSPVRLVIQGNSMSPSLKPGEIVIVQGLSGRKLSVGDVIVVQRDDNLITHRIVAIREDGWYTKGDGTPRLDPPSRLESILGWVDSFEHNGEITHTRSGWRMLIGSMIGMLAWFEGKIFHLFDGRDIHRIGRLVVTPLRIGIWCLAVLWR